MSFDLSERAALSADDRLRIVLDLAGACTWRLEPAGQRLYWEGDPQPLLGWSADELGLWSDLLERVQPEDRPQLEKLQKATDVVSASVRFPRPDGSWRWLCMQGRSTGRAGSRQVYGIVSDETRRQADLRRSRMLSAELQHRVKNMVSIIRSIANRTRRNSADIDVFAAHFDGRLGAFARVHSALARTERGEVDLEEIIREELRLVAPPADEPWTLSGPTVRLRQKVAEQLALAIHELTINALESGALSSPGGRIDIRWRLSDAGPGSRLVFEWIEQNDFPITPSQTRGFGRETIEQALPYQLGAQTEFVFEPQGVRCRIEMAIDQAPLP